MSSRMEQLQALLGENPNDVFLSYALALEHLSIGETEKGISILQDIIQKHPDYIAAYHRLGDVFFSLNQFKEAIDVLSAGIPLAPAGSKAKQEMQNLLEWVIEESE